MVVSGEREEGVRGEVFLSGEDIVQGEREGDGAVGVGRGSGRGGEGRNE